MNILVVGPGAMGCLFAARLKQAANSVTLVDYRSQRADLLNEKGIRVEGIGGAYDVQVPTITETFAGQADVVLICVKANQTRRAAEGIEPWINDAAAILTLQNGLGNVEVLEQIFGKRRVLGGVTAEGATLLGPGRIRHAGAGETVIGPENRAENKVGEIVAAFSAAGFRIRSTANVDDLIWGKLIVNVGINALTAITGLRNGLLPEVGGTKSVMEEAVREAVAVAGAKGIALPYPDPFERVQEVCRATSENIASMLQDVMRKRMTEVDFINGAIVEQGKILGIPTPVNATLASLVASIQETYDRRATID